MKNSWYVWWKNRTNILKITVYRGFHGCTLRQVENIFVQYFGGIEYKIVHQTTTAER